MNSYAVTVFCNKWSCWFGAMLQRYMTRGYRYNSQYAFAGISTSCSGFHGYFMNKKYYHVLSKTSEVEQMATNWSALLYLYFLNIFMWKLTLKYQASSSFMAPPDIRPHEPLARYEKIAGAHAPGMPGTFSPSSGTSDPDMHHGTCVTHVPWCMPGSLTSVFLWSQWRGKTFPAFPAHAQPAILRIWQEAHG